MQKELLGNKARNKPAWKLAREQSDISVALHPSLWDVANILSHVLWVQEKQQAQSKQRAGEDHWDWLCWLEHGNVKVVGPSSYELYALRAGLDDPCACLPIHNILWFYDPLKALPSSALLPLTLTPPFSHVLWKNLEEQTALKTQLKMHQLSKTISEIWHPVNQEIFF